MGLAQTALYFQIRQQLLLQSRPARRHWERLLLVICKFQYLLQHQHQMVDRQLLSISTQLMVGQLGATELILEVRHHRLLLLI